MLYFFILFGRYLRRAQGRGDTFPASHGNSTAVAAGPARINIYSSDFMGFKKEHKYPLCHSTKCALKIQKKIFKYYAFEIPHGLTHTSVFLREFSFINIF